MDANGADRIAQTGLHRQSLVMVIYLHMDLLCDRKIYMFSYQKMSCPAILKLTMQTLVFVCVDESGSSIYAPSGLHYVSTPPPTSSHSKCLDDAKRQVIGDTSSDQSWRKSRTSELFPSYPNIESESMKMWRVRSLRLNFDHIILQISYPNAFSTPSY